MSALIAARAGQRRPGTRDYKVLMPKDTTVVAACEDVGCENWRYGWDTLLDESTAEGRDTAAWIRSGQSGRTFRELPGAADGGMTVFRFESGQRCFAEHRTRPALWVAGRTRHTGMSPWLHDLDDHVGQLADRIAKG